MEAVYTAKPAQRSEPPTSGSKAEFENFKLCHIYITRQSFNKTHFHLPHISCNNDCHLCHNQDLTMASDHGHPSALIGNNENTLVETSGADSSKKSLTDQMKDMLIHHCHIHTPNLVITTIPSPCELFNSDILIRISITNPVALLHHNQIWYYGSTLHTC
jgi:hypothetical protein